MRAILLLLLWAPPLAAQVPALERAPQTRAPRTAWADVGLSYMTLPYGLGANAGLSTRRGNVSFRLGLNGASNLYSTETSSAVSLSVGVHRTAGPLHLEIFAGPAWVWGEDDIGGGESTFEQESYQTVGLLTHASALFGIGSRVRLGVGSWANANSRRSTIGVGPRLQFRLH